MTEITRSIEILAPKNEVWAFIHPSNWPRIFNFVRAVNGYAADGNAGVGTTAQVDTSGDATGVTYKVQITEYEEKSKITYRRYDGPLTGKGIIQLMSLGSGTLLRRTAFYDDDLSSGTIQALSEGMEEDNMRIKKMIEKIGKE